MGGGMTDEKAAIELIRAELDKNDVRMCELFVQERRREKAGEYIAVIIARVLPQDSDCMSISKKFLELFVDGHEIIWRNSYNTIIAEKQLRAIDFVLEAHIRL
jgi:hypothetical protein